MRRDRGQWIEGFRNGFARGFEEFSNQASNQQASWLRLAAKRIVLAPSLSLKTKNHLPATCLSRSIETKSVLANTKTNQDVMHAPRARCKTGKSHSSARDRRHFSKHGSPRERIIPRQQFQTAVIRKPGSCAALARFCRARSFRPPMRRRLPIVDHVGSV